VENESGEGTVETAAWKNIYEQAAEPLLDQQKGERAKGPTEKPKTYLKRKSNRFFGTPFLDGNGEGKGRHKRSGAPSIVLWTGGS